MTVPTSSADIFPKRRKADEEISDHVKATLSRVRQERSSQPVFTSQFHTSRVRSARIRPTRAIRVPRPSFVVTGFSRSLAVSAHSTG